MRNHQKCLYMANVKMMCDNDTAFYLESGRREPSPVLTTGLLTTSTTATTTATTDWFSTEEVSQASTTTTLTASSTTSFTTSFPTSLLTPVTTPVSAIRLSLDRASFDTPDRCAAPFVPLNFDDESWDESLNFLKSQQVDNLRLT